MNGELKDQVARGVAWSIAEKAGSILLQLGVSLVWLRLLMPDQLGVMAIPTAFVAVALVLADSGFSQMLIRKAAPTPEEYKSVFVFNLTASIILYLALVIIAPWVGSYYAMPMIGRIAPIFFLILPINALCAVQNTVLMREFRFALLSKIALAASLISSVVAIGIALAGFGIWSIVAQRVLQMIVRSGLLWWVSAWRPRGAFDGRCLRQMAPYSCSLMTTDLISTFYTKIPQFFLGKLYPTAVLGSFDQAIKLKDQPVTSVMQAVQGVTFPALAKISDDAERFTESYRQVMMVVAYVMFPMMLGMSAVASDMFELLLGEKWMPTVPYFEVICLAGLFYPVAMVAYNILKVKSDGPLIVKLEIVKKIIMTAIFAVTIYHSVQAVVWGLVAIAFCEMVVNFLATTRFTALSSYRFVRTLLPIALVSVAMYAAVWLVGIALPDQMMLRLLCKLVVGVVCYLVLSALFRLEAFREVTGIIKKQVAHK
ncbi:MAG: lipopolysaccharide biosynthesis protein [Alistipes sp.]